MDRWVDGWGDPQTGKMFSKHTSFPTQNRADTWCPECSTACFRREGESHDHVTMTARLARGRYGQRNTPCPRAQGSCRTPERRSSPASAKDIPCREGPSFPSLPFSPGTPQLPLLSFPFSSSAGSPCCFDSPTPRILPGSSSPCRCADPVGDRKSVV